jgi:hypothetical protein
MLVYILYIDRKDSKELIGVFDKEHIRDTLIQAQKDNPYEWYNVVKARKAVLNTVVHPLGLGL